MSDPIVVLTDLDVESFWAEDYVVLADAALRLSGCLSRPLTEHDRSAAEAVLNDLAETNLDVTDVFPLGMVWVLRSRGAIAGTDAIDAQLEGWRDWEENDHCRTPLPFLPPLSAPTPEGSQQP